MLTTVYVNPSPGSKYHSAGCQYLLDSMVPMKVADAAGQYEPCSVCNPPTVGSQAPSVASRSSAPPNSTPTDTSGISGDRTATGLPIFTGPRGGRYHISKSGKKVYERKKR
jgi:hypothetical protein